MRKILAFIIICVLSTFEIMAQENHLTFKGIPINGNVSDFVNKMKEDGFTLKQTFSDGSAVMEGKFADKYCDLYVLATPTSKTVWKVAVMLKKEYTNWPDIESDYNELKNLYSIKYGSPLDDFSFFSSPYKLGDGYEMTALRMDKCSYMVLYKVEDIGHIAINMTTLCKISIAYEDSINAKVKDVESKTRIIDDI